MPLYQDPPTSAMESYRMVCDYCRVYARHMQISRMHLVDLRDMYTRPEDLAVYLGQRMGFQLINERYGGGRVFACPGCWEQLQAWQQEFGFSPEAVSIDSFDNYAPLYNNELEARRRTRERNATYRVQQEWEDSVRGALKLGPNVLPPEKIDSINQEQLRNHPIRCPLNSLHALPYARNDGLFCQECQRIVVQARNLYAVRGFNMNLVGTI